MNGRGTTQPAVELVDVARIFEGVTAVDNVSLTIGEGEFFSLLGPSGCGKSTTLRMIGGFEQPTSGDILIRGARMGRSPPNKRPTNMVFQHLGLFPHLTVFENVAFGLRLKRAGAKDVETRVKKNLEIVNLAGYEKRFPDELSGGQQQRVAIARALVNEPSVLLLDEPLGALDLRLRQKMQTELTDIQRRLNTTFVYVTHDQSEAFTMSDRIGIMNEGRLEQVASPRSIYLAPATAFVADFVGETNLLDARVTAISGEEARMEAAGLTFSVPLEGLSEGKTVTYSLRPEKISLSRSPGAIAEPVTVRKTTFQGSSILLALETPSGRHLTGRIVDGAPGSDFAPEDTAYIAFAPEHLRTVA